MAKIKPAGGKKPKPGASMAAAVPCFVLLIIGFTLLGFLLYFSLQR